MAATVNAVPLDKLVERQIIIIERVPPEQLPAIHEYVSHVYSNMYTDSSKADNLA